MIRLPHIFNFYISVQILSDLYDRLLFTIGTYYLPKRDTGGFPMQTTEKALSYVMVCIVSSEKAMPGRQSVR